MAGVLGRKEIAAEDYNTGERRAGGNPEFENEHFSDGEYNFGANNVQENVQGLDEVDNVTTCSGSEAKRSRSRSPRSSNWARIRTQEGIRRRRFQNRSTKKKLWDSVQSLFTVLATCSVAMGTWAQEVMGDPLWDAWAVMQPHHPHEEPFKVDWRKSEIQEDIVEEIWTQRPKLVWLAPPCTVWCQFSRLNYPPQELRRIRRKEKGLLTFVQRVFELQQMLGGVVAIENLRTSDIWRQPQFDSIMKEENVCFADLDLCQYGLVSVADGKPLKKGVSILTNNQVFAQELAVRCPGQHEHRPIQGRDTAASATYPLDFAKAVVKALDGARRNEAQTSTHFPTSTVLSLGLGRKRWSLPEALKQSTSRARSSRWSLRR